MTPITVLSTSNIIGNITQRQKTSDLCPRLASTSWLQKAYAEHAVFDIPVKEVSQSVRRAFADIPEAIAEEDF
jgi:hypothetical protein